MITLLIIAVLVVLVLTLSVLLRLAVTPLVKAQQGTMHTTTAVEVKPSADITTP